ncbi:MAG: MarR family transcriptional regulator [Oscillospiraceae bacterium]
MLEQDFTNIYTKFKLRFYSIIFRNFEEREASLSTVEVFCVEVIYALNRPTIREFAEFAQISSPNAAYKINSLIKKGYVKKIQNKNDKREFYLEVTQKYIDYCGITYNYIDTVMQRVRERFSKEEIDKFEEMLSVINNELMPELPTI